MNRVINDVLPTDCSPRNTNLNFRSGLPKSPEVDMLYFWFIASIIVLFESTSSHQTNLHTVEQFRRYGRNTFTDISYRISVQQYQLGNVMFWMAMVHQRTLFLM